MKYSIQHTTPKNFFKYYKIYYAQKYSDYYLRNTLDCSIEKLEYIDSCYFIFEEKKLIGGVIVKPNFISDLFLIPPFNDYSSIIKYLVNYAKSISTEDLLAYEVIEDQVKYFEKEGFCLKQNGFWMTRLTQKLNYQLHPDFISRDIKVEDSAEIGELIANTYNQNPAIKTPYSAADYANSVKNFFDYTKEHPSLYEASQVITCKNSNQIVGVILHMEFEQLPLITELAVSPKHQGKKLGSYLLKYSISSCAKSYDALRLFVHEGNTAIKAYKKLGFYHNKSLNDLVLIKG